MILLVGFAMYVLNYLELVPFPMWLVAATISLDLISRVFTGVLAVKERVSD